MRERLAALGLVAAGLTLSACGPTVMNSQIIGTLNDPPARLEIRLVQPDILDTWTTHELWGVNAGSEPVCAGRRDAGMSWDAFLIPPRSELRLQGLGNDPGPGQTALVPLNGRTCSVGLLIGP